MKYEKEKEEFYEEMERDETELLNSKKKSKKSFVLRFIKLGFIILISILFIIYLISKHFNKINNHYELTEKTTSKLNPPEITMKLNFTFDYDENNTIYEIKRIWGEPDYEFLYSKTYKETFYISALSQFPSGNFIFYDYTFIVIYDKYFNVLQTISPFVDEFGKYNWGEIHYQIMKILIKDENNFILLTNYGTLKLYKKEGKNYIFKNETKDEKLISDMTFDNSKTKIFSLAEGFIKIFREDDNGNYSKIKEIKVPEFQFLSNINGNFDEHGFDAHGYNNRILLWEDKNILIVKETRSLWFFNISENYRLFNVYKEKYPSDILSIDRYDEDKIIVICNLKSLKIISVTENKVIKFVKEINNEKYVDFRIIKTVQEKNIIILGGTYDTGSIIQILTLDTLQIIQTIKLPQYVWTNGIYRHKNDLIATIFSTGIKLWYISSKNFYY